MSSGSTLLVLGARHLGAAVARRFASDGWNVATVSLSESTAEAVRARIPGVLAMTADAGDPAELGEVLARVRERFGGLDAVVNAVTPRGGGPGSGLLLEAPADAIDAYARELVPGVWTFFRVSGRALVETGGGSLVQVTGGSARRAMAGKGAWAAGAFATRALSQAAALELREHGVHAALLVIDAILESDKTREMLADRPDDASASMEDAAAAIAFLVGQSPRAWTHELVITPRGDRWVP